MNKIINAQRVFIERFCQAFGVDVVEVNEDEEEYLGVYPDLDALEASTKQVEAQLDGVCDGVDRWNTWRSNEVERRDIMQNTLEEVRVAAEQMRERLLAWREMLK